MTFPPLQWFLTQYSTKSFSLRPTFLGKTIRFLLRIVAVRLNLQTKRKTAPYKEHSLRKQGIRLYKCYFALQNACWAVPKPHLFCIVPMQAAHLFQTLLRRRHFLRRQDLKQSPSFPAAFPASPSPLPESGGALRMNTTYGRRCTALCGRQYDAALRRPDLLHQFEHQLLAVPFYTYARPP